jgi:hypothetical protein
MRPYRNLQGRIVEQMGPKLYVDPVLSSLIRHHVGEGDDEDTVRLTAGLLRFVSLRIERDHLDVLLQMLPNPLPFAAVNLSTRTDGMAHDVVRITCSTLLAPGVFWDGSSLKCENSVLPESVRTIARGMPLGDLVGHPYLPTDLPLASITQGKTHWVANFKAPKRQGA